VANVVVAQIDSVRFNGAYLKKYWTDTKAIVSSPARWDQRDWIKFGALASFTAGLTLADQPVADFFQSHKNSTESYISRNVLEHFGAEHSFILMSGIFVYGAFKQDNRCISTALLALESYSLASLMVRVPKWLVGRQRPDNWEGNGPYEINGPFKGSSFPSGHTTASFAVASVLATQFREIKWVPFAAYSVASMVGISRLYDNKHWLSDVVAGAAIGTLVGNLVSHRTSNSKLALVPIAASNYQGVQLTYLW
jgi:membrane-associated phospholipid phosphatase